jgi:hypothetical protein
MHLGGEGCQLYGLALVGQLGLIWGATLRYFAVS